MRTSRMTVMRVAVAATALLACGSVAAANPKIEQNPEKNLDYFLNPQAGAEPSSAASTSPQTPNDETDGLASFRL